MKHLIRYIPLFCIALCINNLNASLPKIQPNPTVKIDDNKDAQVVTQSMGAMIQALGTFSQDPKNPVVAGACALQALGAFIKMIIQIFDDFALTRNLNTQEDIEQWFTNLPKEKQAQIIKLMFAWNHINK